MLAVTATIGGAFPFHGEAAGLTQKHPTAIKSCGDDDHTDDKFLHLLTKAKRFASLISNKCAEIS
jgi:hypothetical protein